MGRIRKHLQVKPQRVSLRSHCIGLHATERIRAGAAAVLPRTRSALRCQCLRSFDAGTYITLGRPSEPRSSREPRILALLQRHPRGLTTSDIAAQMGGIPNYEAQRVALDLQERGLLHLQPTGPVEVNYGSLARRFKTVSDRKTFLEMAGLDAAELDDDDARGMTLSAKDGAKLAELALPAPPAAEGLAVAGGRVYVSTQDGRVLCYGRK